MIVAYEWPGLAVDVPAQGTWLNISGNPDRAVLVGMVMVARVDDADPIELSILIPDGQDGSEDFQAWLAESGDLGIEVSEQQNRSIITGAVLKSA